MYPDAFEKARALYAALGESTVVAALEEGFENDGYRGAMLRAAELMAGRADSVYTPAFDIARLYLNAGRNREALEWLKRGVEERSPDTPYIIHSLWDPIRGDPQFQEILRGVNLLK